MLQKSKEYKNRIKKLQQAVDLLKFILTLDEEVKNSTIESVIDILEEEINR